MDMLSRIKKGLGLVLPWYAYEQVRYYARRSLGPYLDDEYAGRNGFFRKAFRTLQFNGIDGDYFEFGCHGCGTFRMAHEWSRRHGHQCRLYAFDSFEGLPRQSAAEDAHPAWLSGAMATSQARFHQLCRIGRIPRARYEIIPGYYSASLTSARAQELPTNVCLAYIDCDLYSSTRPVLDFLASRLKHGMIIAFDDWFCYSRDRDSGERAACREFFEGQSGWALVPYLNYSCAGMSFIVYRSDYAGTEGASAAVLAAS